MERGRKYTQEEDDFLRKNYKNMTRKEVAKKLGRTEPSIKKRLIVLGITKEKLNMSNWTKEEDDYLIENYEKLSSHEIAELLNRTEGAVKSRFRILGFKIRMNRRWTKEEDDYLRNNYKEICQLRK